MKEDKLIERGFELKEIFNCPIPNVNADAKQYVYTRHSDTIIFDTQQNGIKITGTWYDPVDFRAIVNKAEQLGMCF